MIIDCEKLTEQNCVSEQRWFIAEAYHLMTDGLGMSHSEMGEIFADWNRGELDSFLIEITANILKYKDEDGLPLVTKIRDAAGQKGTGKWTAISGMITNTNTALFTFI